MLKSGWYLPAIACALVTILTLGVSAPWRDTAASLVSFVLILASLSLCSYAQRLPNIRAFGLWHWFSILAAAGIVLSAVATEGIQHAIWGFSFDLTSMIFLLACISFALFLPLFPSRPRLVALTVAVAALMFLWSVPFLRTVPEVRPSLSASVEIALTMGSERGTRFLLLGGGPNSFVYLWTQYAPESVRASPFWAERFPVGSGIIPTLISELGIVVVLLLMLSFIARSAEQGYKLSLRWRFGNTRSRAVDAAHAALPLVAFVALFLAPPSAALLLASFTILGASGRESASAIAPSRIARAMSKAGIVFFAVCILGALYVGIAAAFYFRAATLFSQGDLGRARTAVGRSYALSGDPQSARLIASIVRKLAHETAQRGSLEDVSRLYMDALLSMRLATQREPSFADNWSVFGVIAAEQYATTRDGSFFEISRGALERARTKAPDDARIPFFQGQLYLLADRKDEGATYLKESLKMRPDLADARTLLDSLETTGASAPAR